MFYSMWPRLALAMAAGAVALGALIQTAAANDLYRAQTTVTGQGEENRAIGVERCLMDVLTKVSGSMQLARDARLAAYMPKAGTFVASFAYVDQMSGTPKRDEQGTRDRPYDLIVDFDQDRVNRLLVELHLKPWHSPRPLVATVVTMDPGGTTFAVSSDSKRSELQKEALIAAAGKRGLQIVLPDAATLAKFDLTDPRAMSSPAMTAALAERGAQAILVGSLAWLDPELKWRADWKLAWKGRMHQWQSGATTFDEVFRLGLGDALEILAQDH